MTVPFRGRTVFDSLTIEVGSRVEKRLVSSRLSSLPVLASEFYRHWPMPTQGHAIGSQLQGPV